MTVIDEPTTEQLLTHRGGLEPGPGARALVPSERERPLTDVVRSSLVAQLDGPAGAGGVGVILAAAGTGKSVLLAQWSAGRSDDAELLGRCKTSADVELLADRCGGRRARTLVLDDVDIAEGTPEARRLSDVIRRRHPGTALLMATRRTWLAELAAGETGLVLDAAALAFTPEDVRRLITSTGRPPVADHVVEEMLERTQGWAIAVRLAVLDGSDRHLRAYFHEELLRPEVPRVQRFLRRCSTLDVLDASLCARTCDAAAEDILHDLLSRSLPQDRHAAAEGRLALHPLLRQALLRELRIAEPAAEEWILANAAEVYRQHHRPEAAAAILVRTRRWDELLDLVSAEGSALAAGGCADDVVRWVDAIPHGNDDGPDMTLQRASLLTMAGHTDRAENELRALDGRGVTRAELAIASTIRSLSTFFDGSPTIASDAARRALDLLDDERAAPLSSVPEVLGASTADDLRFIARTAHARALWLLGRVDHARAELIDLIDQGDGSEPFRSTALGSLALLHAWRGDAARARADAERALGHARDASVAQINSTVEGWLALAHVDSARGDLRGAEGHLRAAVDSLRGVNSPIGEAMCAVESAEFLLARGHPLRALSVIDRNWATSGREPIPLVDDRLQAAQVRALVALGASDRARALIDAGVKPALSMTAGVAVSIAVSDGDLLLAERRLRALEGIADGGADCRIRVEMLAAILDREEGKRGSAAVRVGRAVDLALASGNLRTILDIGPPAIRALRAMQRQDHSSARATVLALALEAAVPLSERELEIVRFLPTPLRSAQIAATLFISLNTLKTHLAAIYRKLDVQDRSGASQRAIELGLA